MDRLQLLDMVARAQREADECKRRMLVRREQIRSVRDAGEDPGEAAKILFRLESSYDALIAELEKLLAELDKHSETR